MGYLRCEHTQIARRDVEMGKHTFIGWPPLQEGHPCSSCSPSYSDSTGQQLQWLLGAGTGGRKIYDWYLFLPTP
jgi:hypothetical protein